MYAARNGHDQCAGALIEAGASLHVVSTDNFTMLMAASLGGLLSMVERLLPLSAVDATVVATSMYQGGYSALMYGCKEGHIEVVRCLLRAGADRELRATHGATALSLARDGGHEAVIELLLAPEQDQRRRRYPSRRRLLDPHLCR